MSDEVPPPPPSSFVWDRVNSIAYFGGTAWYQFKDDTSARRAFRVRPDDHSATRALAEPYEDNHMLAYTGDNIMRSQCCMQALKLGFNFKDFEEWYKNLAAKNRFLALLADKSGFTAYLERIAGGDPVRNRRFWEHEKADAVEAFFGAVAEDCGGDMATFDEAMRAFGVFFPRDAAEQSFLLSLMAEANQKAVDEERLRQSMGIWVRR